MHPLHDYIAGQLSDKLKAKKVVVWYDARSEFTAFVDELRGTPPTEGGLASVTTAGISARLAEYRQSMLEVRALVEPHVSGDAPDNIVVYVGGQRDPKGSVLTELEKAGDCWEPQLKQLGRLLLRRRFTDGVIDGILAPAKLTYEDLAHACEDESERPSVLKVVFRGMSGGDDLLAAWLASDERDSEIEAKEATPELVKLVRSRLGLELPTGAFLAKLRALTLRYLLAGEFRSDLAGEPPTSLDGVASPANKDELESVRTLAARLRRDYAAGYPALADQVEEELGLSRTTVQAEALGSIDTFRFEERLLLGRCGDFIARGKYVEALDLVHERQDSFWLNHELTRKAQWEACRLMAELGRLAEDTKGALPKAGGDASSWIAAYTDKDGWSRMDQAQRRLEAWVANLDDEPDERPLGLVRRAYAEACQIMAEGFTKAIVKANWSVTTSLHQTGVFKEVVADRPKPVAYFLVDAMRFEMGAELAERLPKSSEVSLRPAVAALPSITPIGMAALQPGAAASFSVVEEGGKLGVRIDGAFLPDVNARRKFASARVPNLVDLSLDEVLGMSASKLTKAVESFQVVVVRSQEIDLAGEAGFYHARQIMDTVIDNLARAIRRLSAAGIEQAVVSADHGHLFFAADLDESMRVDAPGGQTVELHRRCWIGRGGSTPPGCVRVSAFALGYESDLDFVFPRCGGVFKSGGDLAYHHGGCSLQEMVVPVLTVRTPARVASAAAAEPVTATGLPSAITNRIFSVTLQLGGQTLALFSGSMVVKPLLMSSGRQVGHVGMAVGAELDPDTGFLQLQTGKPVTAAFVLTDEKAESVRVVVQDPATDAELYRSPSDIPVQLGVA
jgi:hypothetical protein